MSSGDAGLEHNHGPLCLARAEQDRLRAERDDLRAEVARLREQLAEWESAHSATVELRSVIEAHMDLARGQWQCVAQLAAQQVVIDAARWVITETRRAEHARCGKSCIWRGLIDSLAALDKGQAAQPEGERETNQRKDTNA